MASEATAHLPKKQIITHEFVNSLSSVRSLADLLVEYPSLDAGDRSKFITIIRDETERLVRLMDSVSLEVQTTSTI